MRSEVTRPISPSVGVRERLLAAGPMLLAFLAGQHHALHMAILTLIAGTAGATFMTASPNVRRVMLGVSVLTALVAAYRASRPGRPRAMRLTHALSVVTTVALVVWSIAEFGL